MSILKKIGKAGLVVLGFFAVFFTVSSRTSSHSASSFAHVDGINGNIAYADVPLSSTSSTSSTSDSAGSGSDCGADSSCGGSDSGSSGGGCDCGSGK